MTRRCRAVGNEAPLMHQLQAASRPYQATGGCSLRLLEDNKGFFDNVSHDWMLRCLEVRIQDPSFLLLIRRFLKAGYVDAGQLVLTEQGTPQGGVISAPSSPTYSCTMYWISVLRRRGSVKDLSLFGLSS